MGEQVSVWGRGRGRVGIELITKQEYSKSAFPMASSPAVTSCTGSTPQLIHLWQATCNHEHDITHFPCMCVAIAWGFEKV